MCRCVFCVAYQCIFVVSIRISFVLALNCLCIYLDLFVQLILVSVNVEARARVGPCRGEPEEREAISARLIVRNRTVYNTSPPVYLSMNVSVLVPYGQPCVPLLPKSIRAISHPVSPTHLRNLRRHTHCERPHRKTHITHADNSIPKPHGFLY